jgi:hypothetical protein
MTVAVLALGIGINAAMFAVVHGVLWKLLPFRDPARLVMIWRVAHATKVST